MILVIDGKWGVALKMVCPLTNLGNQIKKTSHVEPNYWD